MAARAMPSDERGDADAAAGELADRDAEAVVLAAQDGARRHAAAVEAHALVDEPTWPVLLSALPMTRPGVLGLDEKAGDALALRGLGVGHRPDHEEAGIFGAGDEDLLAVEDEAVAVAPRRRLHAGRVGAGARLGQAEGAGRMGAVGEARQDGARCCLRAPWPG